LNPFSLLQESKVIYFWLNKIQKNIKPVKILTGSAVIILTFCFAALIGHGSAAKTLNTTVHGDGFAVLELFTSEGCSSCAG
jgi:hypothetical protein